MTKNSRKDGKGIFEMNLLIVSFSQIFRRSFAVAAVKKGSSEKKTKQVFMKKMKDIRSSSSSDGQIGVNRTAPLTQALFQVDPNCVKAAEEARSNPGEMKRRVVIEAAWERHEAYRNAEINTWEQSYLQSKIKALLALREVSEILFKRAVRLDYSLPPVYRRFATLAPPEPDKFPIQQEF